MYSATIPPMTRGLTALSNILSKAEAHCAATGIDPATLTTFRLFPDMLNFARQVHLSCDFAARAAARLSGDEVPSFPDVETTLPELRDRIARTLVYIGGVDAEGFKGAEEREIVLNRRGGEMRLSGTDFLTLYALPQFYFHMTTAYNILRHNGVVLGKRDFMGV